MVITAEDLKKFITVENINEQIKNQWNSPHIITKHIIGESIWTALDEWDQIILEAKTHKLIMENELL